MANSETWIHNVKSKVVETQSACRALLLAEVPTGSQTGEFRDALFQTLCNKLQNLSEMFGNDRQPPLIAKMKADASSLLHNRQNASTFGSYLESMYGLSGLVTDAPSLISFHDIFERYKDDKELGDLVDQLVGSLEKVINDADGTLNARLERELKKLLAQLENRKNLSILELGVLAEVVAKFAMEVVALKHGLAGGSLLVDVAISAWKVWRHVGAKVQEGQGEFVRLIELKSANEDFSKWPALNFKSAPSILKKLESDGSEQS